MFEIIACDEKENRFDAEISALLRAVYVDAGFTPPAVVPTAFASAEIKSAARSFLR